MLKVVAAAMFLFGVAAIFLGANSRLESEALSSITGNALVLQEYLFIYFCIALGAFIVAVSVALIFLGDKIKSKE